MKEKNDSGSRSRSTHVLAFGLALAFGFSAVFVLGVRQSAESELHEPKLAVTSEPPAPARDIAVASKNAEEQGVKELLPDLVPLPPRDVSLAVDEGSVRLVFSTTLYNQGDGPLELRADPLVAAVPGDVQHFVSQRIYRSDGEYRDRHAGTFLWHDSHVHYHFADVVTYTLEPVDVRGDDAVRARRSRKATFCMRDVSTVSLELPQRSPNAQYLICGKKRQGVSVGWGDTYFSTYPDQDFTITDFPSGTYRLGFAVNPENRFEEKRADNNESSVLISLDMDEREVEVLREFPADVPAVEHVYEEQVFEVE